MNELELFGELIDDLARDLRPEVEPLTLDALYWLPGVQTNSIGVTLWHIARGLDFLAVRVLQGKDPEAQLWYTCSWASRTGYDPHGHGYGGWGVITGYTWEEVLAIPQLPAAELLSYLDQACRACSAALSDLSPETFHQRVPDLLNGRLSAYQWVKTFYKGSQAHVGEIMAIKAMYKKKAHEGITA